MKFWDDWADPEDMEAMWDHPEVSKEWVAAGEVRGKKVHMLRDPDGRPYLTQTEIQGITEILIKRHFGEPPYSVSPAMICAIVEIESQRHPLAFSYNSRTKETFSGLMRMRKSNVDFLFRDKGFSAYEVDWKSTMLIRPFVGVYYGTALLKCLSTYKGRPRSEEFIVRSYHAGPKYVDSKKSLAYWNRYMSAKQSFQMKWEKPSVELHQPPPHVQKSFSVGTAKKILYETSPGRKWVYWEEKTLVEDLAEMWKQPEVRTVWKKTGKKRSGRLVPFSVDAQMRPYLKKVELKCVASIVVEKYFPDKGINPAMLCTIAEISSKRLLFGDWSDTGIMQMPFSTASWLYETLGYKSYKLKSVEDLTRPFVSLYFGAAYVSWLSRYGGRVRSDRFIVQSYCGGPKNMESPEAGCFWLKYVDNLPHYVSLQRAGHGDCCIQ